MKLVRLRLSNFWSFGPGPTVVTLPDITYLLGPNGAGKTAVLQALARMFSLDPGQRRIRRSDFHIPADEATVDAPLTRELWIEADFEFPELEEDSADEADHPAVPGSFAHMQLVAEDGPAQVRYRLRATIDQDEDIEERFTYVISAGIDGSPAEESNVQKQDRNAIQVHYLPARRDPADHISYSANALLGRALRSADWSATREAISTLTAEISEELTDNPAIGGIAAALTEQWSSLHRGSYYASPSVSFGRNEIENLLRHLGVGFAPGHGENTVDFTRLSDGQKSLLYVSIVLAMHSVGTKVLAGELSGAFDIDKLRPAVFTLVAIEEPENSLSPHYLGRVVKALTKFAQGQNSQALVATHSPSLLRRVPPESVRYLRLSAERTTAVKGIELPPRLLHTRGILADDASVSIVPLGGRHVNHFWRLLNGLGVPHVTLLDLDVARHQGGWGRVRYAATELLKYADIDGNDLAQEEIDGIPAWNADEGIIIDDLGWIARLEALGVFFSAPLDLDFMMMTCYPGAYWVKESELGQPDQTTIKAVLGKNHDELGGQYTDAEQEYFDAYYRRFKLGSKPTCHIRAMARLEDGVLVEAIPNVLDRMLVSIETKLADLHE